MTYKFGVVEDINDPLKLGRCRVRVMGIHTSDTTQLPTTDLPWSLPLQHIGSAAVSGVGNSPTGILQGSYVLVLFVDPEEQSCIIMGTIAGIPANKDGLLENTSNAEDLFDSLNKTTTETLPVERELNQGGDTTAPTEAYIGALTRAQYEKFKETLKMRESSGDHLIVNQIGYVGWYQFGVGALETIGYLVKGTLSKYKSNSILKDPTVWSKKSGIASLESFLNNKKEQDNAMWLYTQSNYNILKSNGLVSAATPAEKLAGLLAVAHNQGHSAATAYTKGIVGKDGNGVTSTEYYNLGFNSVYGNTTLEHPQEKTLNRDPIDTSIHRALGNAKYDVAESEVAKAASVPVAGFMDPNKEYPLDSWINEPDTHRLARNQQLEKTIVGEKESDRDQNIAVALGSATWNQPKIPYNTKYPYNKVFATTSGHVFEFDDTPECERINLHHSSGTFIEIDSNGTVTTRTKGHNAIIIDKDGLIHIKGSSHIHVDNDATIFAGGSIYTEASGDINFKGKNINIDASGKFNVSAAEGINLKSAAVGVSGQAISLVGAAINLDGFVATNTGAGTSAASEAISLDVSGQMQYAGEIVELPIKSRHEDADITLEGEDEAVIKNALSVATSADEDVKVTAKETFEKVSGDAVTCGFTLPLNNKTILTTNFKLEQFCLDGGFNFKGQHGLSPAEIACNLKNLSANVIEPCFGRYKVEGIRLNSVFRPEGSKVSKSKKTSQHELGEAVDLGFVNLKGKPNTRQLYYEMALKIREVVPFDQLLLEYTSTGSVWIHVSYTTKRKLRYEVLTMNNHSVVGTGLILLGPKGK